MQSETNKTSSEHMTEEVVKKQNVSPEKHIVTLQLSNPEDQENNVQNLNEENSSGLDDAVYQNMPQTVLQVGKETVDTNGQAKPATPDVESDNTTVNNIHLSPGPIKEGNVYINGSYEGQIEDNIYQNTLVKDGGHVNEVYINVPTNVLHDKKEAQSTVVVIQNDNTESETDRVQPKSKRHGNLYVRGPPTNGEVEDEIYQNTFGEHVNGTQKVVSPVYENASTTDRVYENTQNLTKGGKSTDKSTKEQGNEKCKTASASKVEFAGYVFYCRLYHKVLLAAILLGLIVIIVLVMMLTMCVKCIKKYQ